MGSPAECGEQGRPIHTPHSGWGCGAAKPALLAGGMHLLTPNLESAGKPARKAGGKAAGKIYRNAAGKAAGKAAREAARRGPPWRCAAAPEHLSEEHLAQHVHHDVLVLLVELVLPLPKLIVAPRARLLRRLTARPRVLYTLEAFSGVGVARLVRVLCQRRPPVDFASTLVRVAMHIKYLASLTQSHPSPNHNFLLTNNSALALSKNTAQHTRPQARRSRWFGCTPTRGRIR